MKSEFWCYEPSEIRYDLLDPGVREVVIFLVSRGFHTTDSGDGESKRAKGWTEEGGLVPFPHVYMDVEPGQIDAESDRLVNSLFAAGIEVASQTEAWAEVIEAHGNKADGEGKPRPYIEVTYDPISRRAVMGLFNVTSDMMSAARR
jgi:hypothetical protein